MRCVRSVTAVIVAFCLLCGSGCAWLDVKQRQLIYRPTPGVPAEFAGLRLGDERYFLEVPSTAGSDAAPGAGLPQAVQRIELWWLPHPDKTAPTLLYFHGTFRTLFQNLPKIDALREAGFAVLAVEYRGWGLSTAITPSEQSILQDADLAWVELRRREPRSQSRVLYGHSMGSGVAVDLASRLQAQVDYGALILESAFTSFRDVALDAGLVTGLAAYANNERFASDEKIGRVHVPLLMMHGSLDSTIPMRLGERLFSAANPPKEWRTIEGGEHSDLQQADRAGYQATLRRFVSKYLAPKP
ncbi:MAG: alpha/beta hydrolase, partial [Rhodoferax sp.]